MMKKTIIPSLKALKRIVLFFVFGRKTCDAITFKICREFIFVPFFEKSCTKIFCKMWLKKDGNKTYFDFNGAKFPDISNRKDMPELTAIFEDVLQISCFFDDNYDKKIVEKMDKYTKEGPYGYCTKNFDVSVKAGDTVIDVGAWIGDFSAYCSSKKATTYAFEPTVELFELLQQTKSLNEQAGGGKIHTIQKALGSKNGKMELSIEQNGSGANSISMERSNAKSTVIVQTLDDFVRENKLKNVDFIKADIEGAERELLLGATNVLQTFAPKLAICTYHLPDDPQVLEQIIKAANPNYKVIQMRHKLFATVGNI